MTRLSLKLSSAGNEPRLFGALSLRSNAELARARFHTHLSAGNNKRRTRSLRRCNRPTQPCARHPLLQRSAIGVSNPGPLAARKLAAVFTSAQIDRARGVVTRSLPAAQRSARDRSHTIFLSRKQALPLPLWPGRGEILPYSGQMQREIPVLRHAAVDQFATGLHSNYRRPLRSGA